MNLHQQNWCYTVHIFGAVYQIQTLESKKPYDRDQQLSAHGWPFQWDAVRVGKMKTFFNSYKNGGPNTYFRDTCNHGKCIILRNFAPAWLCNQYLAYHIDVLALWSVRWGKRSIPAYRTFTNYAFVHATIFSSLKKSFCLAPKIPAKILTSEIITKIYTSKQGKELAIALTGSTAV